MAQHTPGPWTLGEIVSYAVGDADFERPITPEDEAVVYMGEGQATVEGVNALADARLIAAAPDLLDNAHNIGGCDLESLLRSADLNLLRATIREWVTEARAAIAKAEGR